MNKNPKVSKQFILGIIFYAIAIIIQLIIMKIIELPQLGKIVIALIPMVPAVWGMMGWLKSQRELDELQQKIAVEAIGFSWGIIAIITFSYGFLETFADFPQISMFWVWPIMAASFILGQFWANRRYN
ncbi:MAG TPA: hypothetical protein ENK21_07575 [Trueperaceae bacterium]|nr:hypothetical protein [Trueperaceae bacterium]